ncbi:GNAT family N-acetyltransferase [Streptomyces nitrosporeus]|nr:GNAT family protein [Streptomyces nitrosporeus]GGY85794.1 N-acetyltransferase [Streptomyces nitrosporeus]
MLTGESVRLRLMDEDDTEAHWRWKHDPDVMRWMDNGYPMTLAQFRAYKAEFPAASYAQIVFGIETLADERLIGLVRLTTDGPEAGGAELDIYIGEKDCWGKGYGTEATRLMCRYGFDTMRLHRVMLWVADANTAAIRAYRKAGFTEEGRARDTVRDGGVWHDSILMGMLEGELR